MKDYKKHIIRSGDNLMVALKKLNSVPENLTLFVLDQNEKLIGTLTDGDVRRGLIRGENTESDVTRFMTFEYFYLNEGNYSVRKIRSVKEQGVKLLPVLDSSGKIIRVIDFNKSKTMLPVEAVLMAGGRGDRLRPITDKIPKSLIKVGSKPIIEHNIDLLMNYGVTDYTIATRYLGEMIEEYFGSGETKDISIKYLRENEPLGTIGALSLMDDFRHDNLLIMNSDLFTNINFEDFYLTFEEEKADICVATVPYNVDIPYAIMNVENDSLITGLKEKPRYTYYANSGIYLMKCLLVREIPSARKTDATDLISEMINSGYKVIKYPIIGYWIDIGKPEDLQKANEFARHLK